MGAILAEISRSVTNKAAAWIVFMVVVVVYFHRRGEIRWNKCEFPQRWRADEPETDAAAEILLNRCWLF